MPALSENDYAVERDDLTVPETVVKDDLRLRRDGYVWLLALRRDDRSRCKSGMLGPEDRH